MFSIHIGNEGVYSPQPHIPKAGRLWALVRVLAPCERITSYTSKSFPTSSGLRGYVSEGDGKNIRGRLRLISCIRSDWRDDVRLVAIVRMAAFHP